VCGCAGRAVAQHHVITRQELRRRASVWYPYRDLIQDPRNLVPVAFVCHERHHSRFLPLELRVLPDSVFEFAAELLGGPAAHSYLARYYRGRDPRLDRLLEAE
jgi:hypothetical protein